MTACHRRIERFLQTLCFAARHCGGRLLSQAEREAIERALRYFREAAPKHTADEEEDLFPALVATLPEVAEPVERLEADHVRAAALHAEVDCLGEKWVQAGELSETNLDAFRRATAELEALYAAHIQVEEGEVFSRADGALDKRQLEAIGRRMAARRGVPFPNAASR
jgi:hemerythrin-like domain-containing protein